MEKVGGGGDAVSGIGKSAGQERHGVVADPRFRDPAGGDYRLHPDSPAFKLGFVDLPYEKMGLEKTDFRPEIPREAEGLREHPEWIR